MECGECTMCCRLLNIPETSSKPNEYCRHCNPGIGCQIYSERPESCRIYECCWKQMKFSADELRPDRCNILFEKKADDLIIGATDNDPTDLILKQIDYFRSEGISVIVLDHSKKSKTFYLAQGHTKEYIKGKI